MISTYAKDTGCLFPIYVDPTRATYDTLGFVTNVQAGESKPKYLVQSTVANVFTSIMSGLMSGSKALSGGKMSQDGGEYVWVDGKLVYSHIMQNSSDHLEIEDLEKILIG